MTEAFEGIVLGKHKADYMRCPKCLLIQAHDPHWLDEAYSSAIAKTDVGLIWRNRQNWMTLRPILHRLFPESARFLDVGGGYGMLCRGLRDDGFDCYTTDRYCDNIYAPDFEPGEGFTAHALLAFEVMEHIENPLEFVRKSFDKYRCKTLIFSTLTHGSADIPPMDWWYYAFETGQHVSLYHEKSLEQLATELGVTLWSLNEGWHIITDQRLDYLDRLLLRPGLPSRIYSKLVDRKRRSMSKLQADYEMVKTDVKEKAAERNRDNS